MTLRDKCSVTLSVGISYTVVALSTEFLMMRKLYMLYFLVAGDLDQMTGVCAHAVSGHLFANVKQRGFVGCRADLLAEKCLVAKTTFVLSRFSVCQNVTLQVLRAPETLVTKLAWQRLVPGRASSHLVGG